MTIEGLPADLLPAGASSDPLAPAVSAPATQVADAPLVARTPGPVASAVSAPAVAALVTNSPVSVALQLPPKANLLIRAVDAVLAYAKHPGLHTTFGVTVAALSIFTSLVPANERTGTTAMGLAYAIATQAIEYLNTK